MIGTTLSDVREHIESLATDSGRYVLVCGRTGDQPVPADGLSFESRAIARVAARATEEYRARLRRYDPHVAHYDVIVREDPSNPRSPPTTREPTISRSGPAPPHGVTGARGGDRP